MANTLSTKPPAADVITASCGSFTEIPSHSLHDGINKTHRPRRRTVTVAKSKRKRSVRNVPFRRERSTQGSVSLAVSHPMIRIPASKRPRYDRNRRPSLKTCVLHCNTYYRYCTIALSTARRETFRFRANFRSKVTHGVMSISTTAF